MLKRKHYILLFFLIVLPLFVACRLESYHPVSQKVLEDAFQTSFKYIDMKYEWGGQSFWYEEGGSVDCSGLIINIYKEVCDSYGLELPFQDTTAYELYSRYTIPVSIPVTGDLVFMGNDSSVSHVAMFYQYCGDEIEFLDAYSISEVVGIRRYQKDDARFISFGRIVAR